MEHSSILIKDVQGDKTPGMLKSILLLGTGGPKLVQVIRGELLTQIPIPSKERVSRSGGPAHNYRSMKDSSVTLYGGDDEVAPVFGKDLMLLEAIEKPYDRFSVFSAGNKLEWGGSLRRGDQVYVKLPSPDASVPTWSLARVHYAGPVKLLPGWNFGVEIKDTRYVGRGSSDGFFGGCKYFKCEKDCGLFVSLDKLCLQPPHQLIEHPGSPEYQNSKTSSPSVPPRTPPVPFLGIGSRVQLPITDRQAPKCYGVIRWIGTVPHILGQVAGIELENYVEGCSDGTLKAAGERFFHYKQCYGLYFPLASVQPVERQSSGSFLQNPMQPLLENEIATLRAQKATLERKLERFQLELDGCKQELISCKKELAARSIDVWTISRNKVQVEAKDIIGAGGWGSVSKGKVEVAVKQLHPIIMSPQNVAKIRREIELLAEVRHPNLVQFIGAVFEEKADVNQPPLIVTELLDMNLRQAYEQNQLGAGGRLSIFMDIARALDYLHQRYEPIIHRDVSAPNVLLQRMPNNHWKGKVSDLGSANFLQQAQTKGEGNILYSPPEVIPRAFNPRRERVPQTTKIDVYSYGVLLCEVTTSRFPSEENYWKMLQSVGRDHPRLHALIENCTQEKPDDRPTMEAVLMQLNTKDMPQF